MHESRFSKAGNISVGFSLGMYVFALYLGYWNHPVRCLECNQIAEQSSQVVIWLGHENVVHFDCIDDMAKHAEAVGKSVGDFNHQ